MVEEEVAEKMEEVIKAKKIKNHPCVTSPSRKLRPPKGRGEAQVRWSDDGWTKTQIWQWGYQPPAGLVFDLLKKPRSRGRLEEMDVSDSES